MMNTLRFGAVAVLAASLLPSCVAASRHYEVVDELARAQDDLSMLGDQLNEAESLLIEYDGGIEALEERTRNAERIAQEKAGMASEREQIDRERQRLAQLNAELERKNQELGNANMNLASQVTNLERAVADAQTSAPPGFDFVVNDQEGLYGYSGQGDIFFSAGKADLTKQGKTALQGLAAELAKHERPIRVVGHTDTDPVKKTKELWPLGNIQLGAGRAMSVMQFLISQGLREERFSVMSYGQHRPLEEGKKERNRRVEIMVEAL